MKLTGNLLLAAALLSCSFCEQKPKLEPQRVDRPQKVEILNGLKHPWSLCFLSESVVLITEKDGNLLKANLTSGEKTIIRGFPKDLADSIRVKDSRDNSGIFEVIKHPEFSNNQLIYISYAAQNKSGTTTKIIRAKLKGDSLMATTSIFVATPFSPDLFHYGGGMTFGGDGKLYFTIGERLYNEIDEPAWPIAQDVRDKRGKIYRLNDDGSVPVDNPDFGKDAIPGIYALGIRAAQGLALDQETGDIWFSEHGPTQGDELNLLQAGANYGWPLKTTGKYRNTAYQPPSSEGLEFSEPQHYWLQTIAPTGLAFYTGDEFSHWKNNLILCGLSRGSLWRIKLDRQEIVSVEELFINDRVRARKIIQSPEGKLYLLTDESDGKLLQIGN